MTRDQGPKTMRYNEIFTPNDHPRVTYVPRDNQKLEEKLKDYIETPNVVVSISGPSKTGKTVLLRKVVSEDNLIPLSGASIKSLDDFWNSIFAWMESPTEKTTSSSSGWSTTAKASGGGEAGLLGFAKARADVGGEVQGSKSKTSAERIPINPFSQVVKDIGKSSYVLFVDDFHYLPKEVQKDIAMVIKGLAESGVKICTASVPHRNEDVVRANAELRGRLASIDIPSWEINELVLIAQKGFEELRADFSPAVFTTLATAVFQSPQLMQALCLNLCRVKDIREPLVEHRRVDVSEEDFKKVFEDTADFASFSKLVELLHAGPKVHGVERKQFNLQDGSTGDVYRVLLLAMKSDPAKRSFTYDDILQRAKAVCIEDAPVGSSVSGSLGHMVSIAEQQGDNEAVLDWDEAHLTIVDPYFAFYLRSSNKVGSLGQL